MGKHSKLDTSIRAEKYVAKKRFTMKRKAWMYSWLNFQQLYLKMIHATDSSWLLHYLSLKNWYVQNNYFWFMTLAWLIFVIKNRWCCQQNNTLASIVQPCWTISVSMGTVYASSRVPKGKGKVIGSPWTAEKTENSWKWARNHNKVAKSKHTSLQTVYMCSHGLWLYFPHHTQTLTWLGRHVCWWHLYGNHRRNQGGPCQGSLDSQSRILPA
jgi:hypothetical protein